MFATLMALSGIGGSQLLKNRPNFETKKRGPFSGSPIRRAYHRGLGNWWHVPSFRTDN
jgi:hypothetical protein